MTMPGSDGLRETIDEAVGHFVHSPPIVDAVERAVRAWEAKRAPLGEAAREVVAPHTGQRAWVAPAPLHSDRPVGWRHPGCEGRSLRDDGSCRWPYCFDWTYSDAERAIIDRTKQRREAP